MKEIFADRWPWLLVPALLIVSLPATGTPGVDGVFPVRDARQPTAQAVGAAPRLPLSFVANAGQFDTAVRFYLRDGRQSVWIGAGEIILSAAAPAAGEGTPAAVRMRFMDFNPAVEVEGEDRLPGVANFYRGNDPKRWITGVATFGAVAQRDLYPGITQIYRGAEGRLKSEFRVAPGADPARIRMQYSGVESLTITDGGELVVRTAAGEWRESAPVAYQRIGSRRLEVPASFLLPGQNQVGFAVGAYDSAHELVIDPTLFFSTYLGGTAADGGAGIAIDSDGNVIVCGNTRSIDFPLMNEMFGTNAGNNDFFVAKLDFTGSVLLYSTYLGGSGRELGGDVAVDPDGNAYCVGWTTSSDLPTTSGVLGPGPFGVGGTVDDAAVVKLDPTGALVYSTYLGGSSDDQPEDIAVDGAGHAYVTGNSASFDFPTTPGAFSTSNQGIWDAFVSKLEIDASDLVYSTFLGGSGFDEPLALALDAAGNAYVTGRTQSPDFPVTAGAYDTVYNGTDTVFLTKLDETGSNLVYSTFLDGISPRFGARQLDVAVDSNANAYVAAPSQGSGFPASPGAFDPTFNGVTDVVVMKVDLGGDNLLYSTFVGGSGEDRPNGIAVDGSGSAYVTGSTTSLDFPLADALSTSLGGAQDAFVAKLSPAGDALPFASYLGGTASDAANGITLRLEGPCLTGGTASTDFPTAAPQPFFPFQPNFSGGPGDAFITCIDTSVCSSLGGITVSSDHFGGEADDFAPLPEDTYPSFALSEHFHRLGLEPTLHFDEMPDGEGVFAHTLDGIPPAPVSALLSIHVRAGADADPGDLLSLQLVGSFFLWSRPLSLLPEAGGGWFPGQEATFVLDLARLPSDAGEIDLLPSLAGGRLDVVVGSHDAVDFVRLEVIRCSTTLELAVLYAEDADPDSVESDLLALGAAIHERSEYFGRFDVEIGRDAADQVIQLPDIVYVEEIRQPFVLMDEARSLIGVDVVQGPPPTYVLGGKGVKLGIIDNGDIEHPCDLPLSRLVHLAAAPVQRHATIVGGIMAGDGDPADGYFSRGMAPEATLYSWAWGGVTSKTLSAVDDYGVWAVNNSYTSGYNNAPYGYRPRELDKLVFDKHLNIFWAMGNDDWGFNYLVNEAGAKNIFVTGGVYDDLTHYGSRGPTQDGRLKPDVVASAVCLDKVTYEGSWCPYGKAWNGTSFASPAAAGVAALLAERFRELNSGTNPRPSLVRAILDNGATDLGNPGPDYTFGFGLLNAPAAIEAVECDNFLMSTIADGDTHTWFLEVSSVVSELRVMTAWTDPRAAGGANPALVNDLDLKVISPFSSVQLPLTLDSNNPAALAVPAVNRRDNIEQVVVASPQSGLWRVEIEGFDVPQGPQEYALTWYGEGAGCTVRVADCVPPPPGMAAWWPLDENAGPSAADLAGNHSASYVGTPVPQASGKVRGALYVDASNYLSVPSSPQLDFEPSADWSVDLWLRASSTGSFLSKVDPQDGTGFEILVYSGNELRLLVVDSSLAYDFHMPGCQINLNQWHHVAITVDWDDPNGLVCYVDGVAHPSPAGPTGVDPAVSNNAPLLMGRGIIIPSSGGFMLDEVEIFRRVLSAAEVEALFAADFTGKCRDVCHVDWDRGFCPGDTQVTATLRLWNFDQLSHLYSYSAAQVPGTGGTPGQGCNVDGPTTFSYPGANPIAVPPGGSPATQIPIEIDRPADLNTAGVVGCYDVLVTNLDTGNAQTCHGSVQETHLLCAIVNPGLGGTTSLRVGRSALLTFTVQNVSGSAQEIKYQIVEATMSTEAGGEAVFSIEGLPPGRPFTGMRSMAAGEIAEIPFEVTAVAYDTFDIRDLLLEIRFDDGSTQVLDSITAEALPPERDIQLLPALELLKAGELDLGVDAVANPGDLIHYTFEVINTGDVELFDATVRDPLVSDINCPSGHPIPSLAPGASQICSGSYAITQADIETGVRNNTAIATGLDAAGNLVSAEDSHSEPIPQLPLLFGDGFESGDTSAWSLTAGGTP